MSPLLFVLFATLTHCDDVTIDPTHRTIVNGSIVLDKHNFEHVMKNEEMFIVMTYVEWCGHCKELKPKWEDLAGALAAKGAKTKIFSALIDDNPKIHNDWDVTSFPAIFYVRNGVHKKCQVPREVKDLLEFVDNNEEDPVIELLEEDLEEVSTSNDVVIVGMFSDLTSATAKLYDTIAWEMEVSSFFAMKRREEMDSDAIVVYSQHEGKPRSRILNEELTKETMHHFIARARRPYVIPFNMDNQKLVFDLDEIKISVLIFHNEEGSEERLIEFGKAARVHSSTMNFVEMRADNDYAERFFNYFNVKDADLPVVYIVDTSAGSKESRMANTKDMTESGVAQLIEDFTTDQIITSKPKTSSEPDDIAPEDWDERNVKYLTGENYEEFVLDKERDVFVMWYKESCPHCQSMEGAWSELAEKYKDHPSLIIAHIKSSNLYKVNDVKVEKVPTFLLYKRSAETSDDAVEWDGKKERNVKELDSFLFDNLFSEKDEL